MPTIAPWLNPPNFLQAAEAGARIGQAQAQMATEAMLKREQLKQAQQEAAGQLGLGYARLSTENKQAEAARAQANARLALQAGRYSDLNQQAGQRQQLGEERLASLDTQRSASNDLKNRSLELATNRAATSEDQRNQMIALSERRLAQAPGNVQEKREQAKIEADSAIAAMNDPGWAANPAQVLQKYPAAANHPIIKNFFNNQNLIQREQNRPLPLADVTTFQGANEIKYKVPQATAAGALGTNAVGALPVRPAAAPVQQQFKAGDQAVQNGITYEFDGQNWNPVQ